MADTVSRRRAIGHIGTFGMGLLAASLLAACGGTAAAVRQAIFASTATSRRLEDLAHPVMLDWTAEWGKARPQLLAGKTDAKTLFDEWQHRFQPQVAASAALYQ